MFDTLGGVAAHPLFVHIPVVLVPLAAIGVVLVALRPSWFMRYGAIVTVLAGIGFIGSAIAANTGEQLQEHLLSTGQSPSAALQDHVDRGDQVPIYAGVFFMLTLAWVLFAWWRRRKGEDVATAKVRKPRAVHAVLALLAVVSGIVATVTVTQAGHSGAASVWHKK
ncbi:MAG: DUF2231 domain-containing protein [Actinomycetota bacterium]